MTDASLLALLHPAGEQPPIDPATASGPPTLDTFAGSVRVEWGTETALTAFGQMPFFIEFLKTAGLFEAWVGDCPLSYTSPNAPEVRDVLGTIMLSVLAGHKRYSHITALRSDGVLPELLGMTKIVSEDAVRRGLTNIAGHDGATWLQWHIDKCTSPLLTEPYILDIDTTVKPLYGHRKARLSATIRRSPASPVMSIIPTCWRGCASSWVLRRWPGTNTRAHIPRADYGC